MNSHPVPAWHPSRVWDFADFRLSFLFIMLDSLVVLAALLKLGPIPKSGSWIIQPQPFLDPTQPDFFWGVVGKPPKKKSQNNQWRIHGTKRYIYLHEWLFLLS